MLVEKGSGMDKTFYYDNNAQQEDGWLEFKAPEVKERELAAYDSLRNTEDGKHLPKINHTNEAPALLYKSPDTIGKAPVQGYWMQYIPHDLTIKPKMAAQVVIFRVQKELLQFLGDKKTVLILSLTHVRDNLALLSKVVAELSLAISKNTGEVYLLDYAGGATPGPKEADELVTKAGEGLTKMLAVLEKA